MGLEALREPDNPVASVRRENTVIQTLVGEMGGKFKVLGLQKALPLKPWTGFTPA